MSQLVSDRSTYWLQSRALNYYTALSDLSFQVLLSKARILSILSTIDCKNVPNSSHLSYPCPLQCDFAAHPIKRQNLLPDSLNLGWPCNLHWPLKCGGSDDEPFSRPGLERPCLLPLFQKPATDMWLGLG